jgi:FXSXX-COOH protein
MGFSVGDAAPQAHGAGMNDEEPSVMNSALIDLDGFVLADLEELDDSALGHALRRILADADGPEDPIAGFQAFI